MTAIAFKKRNPTTQEVKWERFFNMDKTKQCASWEEASQHDPLTETFS